MNIENIKKQYPKDTRVKNIAMNDDFAVPPNTEGTVLFVDDIGTIHVRWDNGSSLGLIVGEDSFIKLEELEPIYEARKTNLKIKSPLIRKEALEAQDHSIDYVVKLSTDEYFSLLHYPLNDRDFIKDFNDKMYQDNTGLNHSIIAYTEDYNDGILIQSEGYDYARYQNYISNVHELLDGRLYEKFNTLKLEKIKVLVVEPNMKPYVAIIDNDSDVIKAMVGGYMELVSLSETAEIICNEDGKLQNLPANRRLGNDILVGRFIIVGNDGGEYFSSLSNNDIKKYEEQFNNIEQINQNEVNKSMKYEIIM